MEDSRRFLDPRVLNRVSRLDLRARLIVEGTVAGRHRSPYKGFSVEFAEHREYAPGDDLRYLGGEPTARTYETLLEVITDEAGSRPFAH